MIDRNQEVINIKDTIEALYPIAVARLEKIDENLFVLEDEQPDKRFVIKQHMPLCTSNFEELLKIYQLAGEYGFAPINVPTKAGSYLGKSEGFIFSLQEFLPGEEINEKYEILLASRLAELHKLLSFNNLTPFVNHFKRVVTDIESAARHYKFDYLIPAVRKVEELSQEFPRQIIHGDLHPGNIIFHKGNVFFIDFDSATYFITGIEVAFSAFRCLGGSPEKINRFVDVYNSSDPPCPIAKEYIWQFLAYCFIQRILFILIERDKGNLQWMADLSNQQRYLKSILEFLNN